MKDVWRFGTRWDEYGCKGTSIFNDVFLKYKIAFAYTSECLKMRESDLIAFSDGYDIIAIGKTLSPASYLSKFDIDYASEDKKYFQNNNITGCRVKIVILDEDDCFRYEMRRRFSAAPQIKKTINDLWNKYTNTCKDGSDLQLNIFHWATKELTQDAFLCWMIQWASEGNFYVNPSLHQIGKKFLETLISKFVPSFTLPKGSIIKIFKQLYRIDIVVKIETYLGDYVILIEDKVHADIYNNLDDYLSFLKKDENFHHCIGFFPILIKTGDQASYHKALYANFKTFLRKDFLDFLVYNDQYRSHPVLNDFYSHIASMEEDVQSFKSKTIGTWIKEWNPWKGFYSYLSQHTPFIAWSYVANANGGFLCSRMDGDTVKEFAGLGLLYWQIESDKKLLCLKLGEVYARHSAIRDQAISIVDKFIAENNIQDIVPPARKGCGCYMTIKVVKQENWLGKDNEIVDLRKITNRLCELAGLIEKITAKTVDS